jgi:hypothetical protein
MNKDQALRLAVEAIDARIQKLAFDANVHERGLGDYPWAGKCAARVRRLRKAREILEADMDKNLPRQVANVCKIGQGEKCCRYLIVGGQGFECAKVQEPMKALIDKRVAEGSFRAKGDNCEGVENLNDASPG